jgi:WhiB family redox-sensing transcriptional regulator
MTITEAPDRPLDPANTPSSADTHFPPARQEILMETVITLIDPSEFAGPDLLEPDSPAERPPGRAPVARCADGNGTMTGLFFSDHVVDIARAKAMCELCPLKQSCLAGAIEREEPWGVWGGELLSGGRIIANKRPCGRPPKRPRPEVVYDEMGPVGVVA